ncbi:caspase family protein [Halioglobus sp. HI00S01]|uniref:caspase family protein n=1 Tax=Halioglobus sp. HI00S01 TaxID=1822214 RepID=UPI0012E8F5C0|nr:caspase family protein [Halioglobus sp. HI00S01]
MDCPVRPGRQEDLLPLGRLFFLYFTGQLVRTKLHKRDNLITALVNGVETEVGEDGMIVTQVELKPGQLAVEVIAIYSDIGVQKITYAIEGSAQPKGTQGEKYALIIGNKNYESPFWSDLVTPEADIQALDELLRNRFGFSTKLSTADGEQNLLLLDASKNEILSTLSLLRKTLQPEDSLVVYYAGHGQLIQDLAYWIPVEGTDEDYTWISAFDITQQLKRTASRHILLISDSCYAGALNRSGATTMEKLDMRNNALEKYAQRPSRMILASGGEEPVADGGGGHSVFANALLRALEEAADQTQGFTVHELFPSVRELTSGRSEQIPMYSPLRNSGHEGGALIFQSL